MREYSYIKKRDGRLVPFDRTKITMAVMKAFAATGEVAKDADLTAEKITIDVIQALRKTQVDVPEVEQVQDLVEEALMAAGCRQTARAYILYRNKRTRFREGKTELMDIVGEISQEALKENANVGNSASAKNFQIGCVASERYNLLRLIPEEFASAHINGDIHIHDLGWYNLTTNCLQIPLDKLLKEGFRTQNGWVRPPKRISSAAVLSAIIMQTSQNDLFGGQSYPFFDTYLSPYAEKASEEEVFQAMEGFVYNLSMMHSRAGGQVVFSSINLGTDTSEGGRKVTRNFLLAYNNGLGKGETPIFPNIIFRLKKGVNFSPGDPNYDLFRLATKVAGRHMNPTFSFMDASLNVPYGDQVAYMGCRSRVMANRRGPEVTEGRGNLSFTTVNLPRLAIRSKGDSGRFFALLDEVVNLAIRQLYHRFKVQCKLKGKDMPFVVGQRLFLGSDEVGPCDFIEPVLVHGTLAVGFIGLAEALTALTGKHHGESAEVQKLGLEIVGRMRRLIDLACEEYDLNYTLLATPAEGLSGRFVKLDKKEFGIIPGVTDRDYYTNSFHVPVHFPITIFDKIRLEGPYHKFCNAGHISYVELASPPENNPEAVEAIVRHMAACDMGYAGINFPIDICGNCGHRGIIAGDCPACGSGDIRRIRRITGYLSTVDKFNEAKRKELFNRVVHA